MPIVGPRINLPASLGYSVALDGKEVATLANNPRIVYRNIMEALRGKNALTLCGWFFVSTQQPNTLATLEGVQQLFGVFYNGGYIARLRYGVQGLGVVELATRPNGISFTAVTPSVTNRPNLTPRGFWTHVTLGIRLSSSLAPGGVADGVQRIWFNGVQNYTNDSANWVGAGAEANGVSAFLANNVAASANVGDLHIGGFNNAVAGDGNASCMAGGVYDVRMFDTLLTTSEITQVMRNPLANTVRQDALALWLKLGEGAGTNVADSSGRVYAFQHGAQLSGNGLQGTAAWSATNTPFGLLP